MDALDELDRKQALLRQTARDTRLRLKYHGTGGSWLEGILARGDRRLADAIELAWRRGEQAFDVTVRLGAVPYHERESQTRGEETFELPWDGDPPPEERR